MSDSIKKYFENQEDEIVENVVSKYRHRSKIGIQKYGTTLQDSPEDLLAFLNHLQEELFRRFFVLRKSDSVNKKSIKDGRTRH